MKFKHWLRFKLTADTTWHGQFKALQSALCSSNGNYQKLVVDVGANDGFFSSNSYPFLKRGWRGVLIEPHPGAFARATTLHMKNSRVTVLNLACSDKREELNLNLYESDEGGSLSALAGGEKHAHTDRPVTSVVPIQVHRLDDLLVAQGVPLDFGVLSIDTEGHDLDVIRGLGLERFRPRAIVTEKNWNEEEKFRHLEKHGYKLHCNLEFDTVWSDSNEVA
ncbi:MAG TPA: FkbM family methyltransferase [Candidatus Limnocylindria bacterium]|jgi:FkbM family methyltransferase|nr:FkbM family methyltransferase [Candidatus Limnocylindria bacterium]